MSRLTDIESYIYDRPDSALVAIRQIDTTALRTKAQKAKFALLHAMALDKNYIDTADTRIIQPAVDYYERHGSPEDRLKAWMYLGIEQYNGGKFDDAIISFYKSDGYSDNVVDDNLKGILYSIMADTFTMTRDHALASGYIDKSIDCFKRSGRKDQEDKERYRKAVNLTQLREWDSADACFKSLMSDTSVNKDLRRDIGIDYASFLLSYPYNNDSLAFCLFSESLAEGGTLHSPYQWFAYAYLLDINGEKDRAKAIWEDESLSDSKNAYQYHYWKHVEEKKRGDYKGAYKDLWLAMRSNDSSIRESFAISAANSQRVFLENKNKENLLTIQNQNRLVWIIVLACLLSALASFTLWIMYKKRLQRQQVDQERIEMVVESLRAEMTEIKGENSRLNNEYRRAKFAFLADIYEDYYRISNKDQDNDERLACVLRSKIGDLRSNHEAQKQFEQLLDKELDGIMTRFRNDFPNLSEKEYCFAGFVFAGFDNTVISIVMDVSTVDNARQQKSRLKRKIANSEVSGKNEYLSLF